MIDALIATALDGLNDRLHEINAELIALNSRLDEIGKLLCKEGDNASEKKETDK